MKVLQIGGTGFLGSHIAKKLIERNHEVTILTRNPECALPFDKSKVAFIKGDILQIDNQIMPSGFDIIVYTAMVPFKPGRISTKKFRELEQIMRRYYENTVALAKKLLCPLIVTSGTSFETKDDETANESWPITRKGMAALGKCYDEILEKVKTEKSVPVIEMLPAQIYGNGGLFGKMIDMAKSGKIVILGSGKNFLPRIHVDDCADAYVLAIEKLPIGKRYIICDDEPVRVLDFTKYLGKIFGATKVIRIPAWLLRIIIGKYVYPTLTMNIKVTNSLIKRELGWIPTFPSYREGLNTLRIEKSTNT